MFRFWVKDVQLVFPFEKQISRLGDINKYSKFYCTSWQILFYRVSLTWFFKKCLVIRVAHYICAVVFLCVT